MADDDFAFLPEYGPDATAPLLVRQMREHFTPARVRDVLLPLINKTSAVSLRVLDWLVVNQAKQHNLLCPRPDGSMCNIHQEYKVTLSVYKRTGYDPFRRHQRSTIRIDGDTHETTRGQCHFIYWAERNGILAYAEKHLETILHAMSSFSSQHRARLREMRKRGVAHKREALTATGDAKCQVYFGTHRVSFRLYD